ncbi:MAG: peptidase domain-containing ABC transporter [Spirulina sp.]
MSETQTDICEFLRAIPPFDQLPDNKLRHWSERFQFLRYRLGQPILDGDTLPYQIVILVEGQARLLGKRPYSKEPLTLQRVQPGEILGWAGSIRGIPCETAIASIESIGIGLHAREFLRLLEAELPLAHFFYQQISPGEIFDLLCPEIQKHPQGKIDDKALIREAIAEATLHYLPPGMTPARSLNDRYQWFASGGGAIARFSVGSPLPRDETPLHVNSAHPARLVGIPTDLLERHFSFPTSDRPSSQNENSIPYAPDRPPTPDFIHPFVENKRPRSYPHIRGKGELESALACLQMLCQYWEMPFRREVIQRILTDQSERGKGISLPLCGGIAELLSLQVQLVDIPSTAISHLEPPALLRWQGSFALLYETSDREIVLGVPETGIVRHSPPQFAEIWGQNGQILLLQPTRETPKQKFGLSWFLPALKRYRFVLVLVFLASFCVQLFGLVNPLMIQVIIDRVIVRNSIDTLHVLGSFLILIAIVEAILSSLRTYLFVDTTNRIDLKLGAEIIDRLLRLPLRYFEKRPVGELAGRVNELENIRQFLTGTALTVVLDAVFSTLYIVVMAFYSWLLTLVALAAIPIFILLALLVSPLIRRQLREKAECNARTQSYLVEVLSGIQTVKAQNIELQSRWNWQDRYARYVSAGFKAVITSTTAGSASNFLNKVSALLVLWVGAYLVLQGELSLGQLIAFRIIAGYVTSPLLRLAQLWQTFQETALSIERLGDILDTPPEAGENNLENIPLPPIQGDLEYENVSFRFAQSGPLQLANINVAIATGSFVGIVGQSGSGKSTLTKLVPRLYSPNAGRILMDHYDIGKVELYSLRRQVGIVPQDSLLFDGSVRDNIALTCPDATSEEIVAAAKIACAHDFIMELPGGYSTRVGERGSALSGGQRQRIAIARTVLQNPRFLILDEATSALDAETERQVCANLQQAFRDRTVLFITHRLHTIRHADLILMMDKGSIVERGDHDALMAMQGLYYCLIRQRDSPP